jgi:GTPase SAR1 family protein
MLLYAFAVAGDLAPGTSDPEWYDSGRDDDGSYFLPRIKKTSKSSKRGKTGQPKKATPAPANGDRKAVKSNSVVNNRTAKQNLHIPREHEMMAFSPGMSMDESSLCGIPISHKNLSVETLKIEQQIQGTQLIVDLIDLTNLEIKDFNYQFTTMSNKTEIRIVDVSHNKLKKIPECFQLDNIFRFRARYNSLQTINVRSRMLNLKELDLNSNDITEFPSVEVLELMPKLTTLILYGNKIKTLPVASLKHLAESELQNLNISFNDLTELPVEIGDISQLKSLRMSNNYIKRLPRSIVNLNHLNSPNSFDVTGNQLVYPPQDIAKLGMINIISYFRIEDENSNVRFNQFKLIVVGHESAGKTSIITYLMEYNVRAESQFSPSSGLGKRQNSDDSLSALSMASGGVPAAPLLRPMRSDLSSMSDGRSSPRSFAGSRGSSRSNSSAGRTVGLEISTLNLRIPASRADWDSEAADEPADGRACNAAKLSGDDVVYLSVWDFAGQEVYHSAHEVRYSVSQSVS